MSEMRVRVEVEIFDEMGDSTTLVGASQRAHTSSNPRLYAQKFDELTDRIQIDICEQLMLKHGGPPRGQK